MPAWIVPAVMGVASMAAQLFGQRKQNKENRKLAEYQNNANQEYMREQLEYNTPKNQMSRWQDASLNPHLIYGQGNPGNQSAPLQYPDIKPADYQRMGEALPVINQSLLTQSQVQAQNAKTVHTYQMTQLAKIQQAVLAANPALNEAGFNAMIDALVATAESKRAGASIATETANWFTGRKSMKVDGVEMHGPAGILKMETELKLMEQRFRLGELDSKVKAEVINGKEFQNYILEMQQRFLKDGEMNSQHVLDFIKLLLMKIKL